MPFKWVKLDQFYCQNSKSGVILCQISGSDVSLWEFCLLLNSIFIHFKFTKSYFKFGYIVLYI